MWNATLDGKGSLDTPITIGKSEYGIGGEGIECGKGREQGVAYLQMESCGIIE